MNVSRHVARLLHVGLLLFVAPGLPACGGRAVDGNPASDADRSDDDMRDPEPGMDSTESDSDSEEQPSKLKLGECKGGHDPGSGSCPWIDYGYSLCFATKEDACACLCPQDRDSVCLSGFYNGEDGHTTVACN